MIGRVDMLEMDEAIDHWKARGIDLSSILYNPQVPGRVGRRCLIAQDHGIDKALDYKLIDHAREAIDNGTPVEFKLPIRNVHRTVGAMLSGEIARKYGSAGLPHETIRFHFNGSAGQSFGAFLAQGRHADARGRCQRLRRQGTLGRQGDRVPAQEFDLCGGGEYRRRQRGPVRRHQRRGVLQRHGRRAIRRRNSGATAVVEASATTAANT